MAGKVNATNYGPEQHAGTATSYGLTPAHAMAYEVLIGKFRWQVWHMQGTCKQVMGGSVRGSYRWGWDTTLGTFLT